MWWYAIERSWGIEEQEPDEGREGLFTAETFAQRLPNSSSLDTVLTLYRENPNGTREVIARNDDYFSRDSFIEVNLGAGVYYIGVSASGNTNFDPTIDDTGLGGDPDVRLGNRGWLLNAAFRYLDTTLEASPPDESIGKTDVDPMIFAVGVGYRF